MKPVIDPIHIDLLEAELTPERFLRKTNKGGNELYITTQHNAPNVMLEIGRLREISFRSSGGGTGLSVDIDEYDYMEKPYHQLIVWNPKEKEIIGGYRYIHGSDVSFDENNIPKLTSSHLFAYSEKFVKDYLPCTIELGRSFVRPEYQSTRMGSKSLFALDNLWDGIGALIITLPHTEYFFGKATMYPTFGEEARNFILYFMNKYFPDEERLIYPHKPMEIFIDKKEMEKIFTGETYKENYQILKEEVRKRDRNIPPLINAYMSLSPTMRTFGTTINDEFGEVEETGLMITVKEIFEEKRIRHVHTYIESCLTNDKMDPGYAKIC